MVMSHFQPESQFEHFDPYHPAGRGGYYPSPSRTGAGPGAAGDFSMERVEYFDPREDTQSPEDDFPKPTVWGIFFYFNINNLLFVQIGCKKVNGQLSFLFH